MQQKENINGPVINPCGTLSNKRNYISNEWKLKPYVWADWFPCSVELQNKQPPNHAYVNDWLLINLRVQFWRKPRVKEPNHFNATCKMFSSIDQTSSLFLHIETPTVAEKVIKTTLHWSVISIHFADIMIAVINFIL